FTNASHVLHGLPVADIALLGMTEALGKDDAGVEVGRNDHEDLLPAVADRKVPFPDSVEDHVRRCLQYLVSAGMAQLVIHPLEMVDVDQEQGQALVPGADLLQPAGKVD